MATVTEMRAWLRDQGHDVPAKGRLRPEYIAAYEQANPPLDDATAAWDDLGAPADGGVTAADFDTPADELEPSEPLREERRPRTQRQRTADHKQATRRSFAQRLFGDDKPAKGKATAKPKHKRVPVESLISSVWEGMARIAAPASLPVSRCLQIQAPVAGLVLEEVIAGTVVDRALQPIARAEEKAQAVWGLIGPPILVAAIEQTSVLPPAQAAVRQAFLMPLLKQSLKSWLTIAGPKVEEKMRQEAEYQEQFGHTIDELIALFFVVPETVTAEPEMAGAAA